MPRHYGGGFISTARQGRIQINRGLQRPKKRRPGVLASLAGGLRRSKRQLIDLPIGRLKSRFKRPKRPVAGSRGRQTLPHGARTGKNRQFAIDFLKDKN